MPYNLNIFAAVHQTKWQPNNLRESVYHSHSEICFSLEGPDNACLYRTRAVPTATD